MENTQGTKRKMLLTLPQGGQGVFTEEQSGAFSGEEEVSGRQQAYSSQAEGRADAKVNKGMACLENQEPGAYCASVGH